MEDKEENLQVKKLIFTSKTGKKLAEKYFKTLINVYWTFLKSF